MRTCLALAFAFAAAPLHGQRAQPVYHGQGYDITFPGRCTAGGMKSGMEDGFRSEMATFACDNTVVIIGRYGSREVEDTTLATRRAMLQLARVGMLHGSAADVTVLSEREFERGDRVGTRMSVRMKPDEEGEEAFYGTAEISVARAGGLALWIVLYLAPGKNAATGPAADRALDSFHLTDVPAVAVERGAERGFIEMPKTSDSAEKPEI